MSLSHLPDLLSNAFGDLAHWLDRRSAARLPELLYGALFARGRRTVTSWFRAAGITDDFRQAYVTACAAGRVEVGLDRYFKALRARFKVDWKAITDAKNTTIGYAVVQAALIGLFHRFMLDGENQPRVEGRLNTLKNSLEEMSGRDAGKGCVFDPDDDRLPNQKKKVQENLGFLIENSQPVEEA